MFTMCRGARSEPDLTGLGRYPLGVFANRFDRVRTAMADEGIDVMLLSVGPDLPWLTGYVAMPLERLTMLVLPVDGEATMLLPAFETARVIPRPDLFRIEGWAETDDPIARTAELVGPGRKLAIGDHTWTRFTLALQQAMPAAAWHAAGTVTGPLRAAKEAAEVEALQRAASGVDRVATALRGGEIPLIGRTEADVAGDLRRRVLAEGHAKVNFAIVASGPNAASPHHTPGDRVIQPGEIVLCDFGGTTVEPDGQPGYCSDLTRCVYTGEVPGHVAEAYGHLLDAQQKATAAATVGTPAGAVDAVARGHLAEFDLDGYFLHRLGHGIGVEAHEDPYLIEGNDVPLAAGNAFSVEPGVYVDGEWGARIEDIVVSTVDGPVSLNTVDRDLAVVEA